MPFALSSARPRGRTTAFAAAGLLAATGVAVTLPAPSADAAVAVSETVTVSPTGSVVATLRGNGHGHGMSQYGALAAARKGLSYSKILAFYYPGTTLTRLAPSTIRVRLSGFPSSSLTVAAASKLTVTGVSGVLPESGVSKYRLVPDSHGGFSLQRLTTAAKATWTTIRTGLKNNAEFRRTNTYSNKLFHSDGSSVSYLGALRAVRSGSGLYPVDRVTLDSYVAGVVPREVPASWPAQTVRAQAVAARSYARYEVENTPSGSAYDICDTTSCQVYGGHVHFSRTGAVQLTDYPSAAKATANQVLRYRSRTIFSQFSASNGGYAISGGQPYLPTKADPYDPSSANPYIGYTRTVKVSSLASYFGLAKVSSIRITKRDGHGAYRGRVVAATISGTSRAGKATSVATDGDNLMWALGVGTSMFTLRKG